MLLLEIRNNQGFFLNDAGGYSSIEIITKDHLLRLVDLTLTKDVSFHMYDESKLQNRAHQIVYKNIYQKIERLG